MTGQEQVHENQAWKVRNSEHRLDMAWVAELNVLLHFLLQVVLAFSDCFRPHTSPSRHSRQDRHQTCVVYKLGYLSAFPRS